MATPVQQQAYEEAADGDYEEEGDAVEEMEQTATEVEPTPVQSETNVKKTGLSLPSDGNNRALKKRKTETGAQDTDAVSGKALEMKPMSEIDMSVFLEVKQQYDIYSAYMNNCGLPFGEIPLEIKTAQRKLANALDQLKQPTLQHLKVLEEAKLLAPRQAGAWRCAVEDPNGPAEAQDRVIGFVACAKNYHDDEKKSLRDENTKLQEQLKKMAQKPQPPQFTQKSTSNRAPPVPPSQKQVVAAAMKKPNGVVNIVGMGASDDVTTRTMTVQTMSRQPTQYDKWISNGNARDPNDFNMDTGMAQVASFFGGLFDRNMADSS